MAWRIEFEENRSVICLTFAGRVSDKDMRDASIAAISMIEERSTRNIMSDFTDVAQLDMSVVDVFEFPKSYKALGLSGTFREAIVSPKQSPVRERVDFYETVCVNRGYDVRTFELRAPALDWLASNEALHPTQKPRG